MARPWFLPTVAAVVFLTAWELFGRAVNPILFSPPSRVAKAFVELTVDGRLPRAFLVTMNALIVGFALSVVVGLTVGVLLGRQATLSRLLAPYIDAIYATPRVVIVPLVIIWFGVGYVGRVFLIWLGTVIPIILNTAIGVRNARPDLVEVARSMGASERDLIRHVIMPASVPYVVAGLRIGAGRALVGVIVAEIFLDLTGLGGIIQTESQYFRTANMLAAVIVVAALGAIVIGSLGGLERRYQSWKTPRGE
ncbi:MAG: ABC transporter permease [Acidimicrobiia bacterium]|jgi:NitT/TauT family transport system permease protein